MSKEKQPKVSKKQLFLNFLTKYAGDMQGVNARAFYIEAEKELGLDYYTVKKYVREQIGQVHIIDGILYVDEEAKLLSTTHKVKRDNDDGNGRGISNKIKKWHFDGFRNRRRQ